MGYDCTNYFPLKTKSKEVQEFLFLLGYEKGEKGFLSGMLGTPYFFFDSKDYKYVEGVYSELYTDNQTGELLFWSRTSV